MTNTIANLQYGKYENKLARPKASELGKGSPEYKEAIRAYYQEEKRLRELFKADLEEEFRVQNSPKKDLLFELSWDRGSGYGFYEVYGVYSALVALIY